MVFLEKASLQRKQFTRMSLFFRQIANEPASAVCRAVESRDLIVSLNLMEENSVEWRTESVIAGEFPTFSLQTLSLKFLFLIIGFDSYLLLSACLREWKSVCVCVCVCSLLSLCGQRFPEESSL